MCKKCDEPKAKVCSFPGCGRDVKHAGLCKSHLCQKYRHRQLTPIVIRQENRGLKCSIDGCENDAWARGWCSTHHSRWRKHGSPDIVLVQKYGELCTFPGCGRKHLTRGLCGGHWQQKQKGKELVEIRRWRHLKEGDEWVIGGRQPAIYVYKPSHPLADADGHVTKHRMVMHDNGFDIKDRSIGFRDGNALNCDIQNLYITNANRAKRMTVCGCCGKRIVYLVSRLPKNGQLFCSRECYFSSDSRNGKKISISDEELSGTMRMSGLTLTEIRARTGMSLYAVLEASRRFQERSGCDFPSSTDSSRRDRLKTSYPEEYKEWARIRLLDNVKMGWRRAFSEFLAEVGIKPSANAVLEFDRNAKKINKMNCGWKAVSARKFYKGVVR